MGAAGGFKSNNLKASVKSYATFQKSLAALKSTDMVKTLDKSAKGEKPEGKAITRTDLKLMQNSDKPLKGTIFYILYTILKSMALLCTSLLYHRNPGLGPFQALVMPCLFGITCQVIQLNLGLKKAVYDGINKTNVVPLIIRTTQGVLSNLINTAVTKFLPLTIIGVVSNLAPVIVVIAAFFLLKEKLKVFEIVIILLTVACVILVVVGGDEGTSTTSP